MEKLSNGHYKLHRIPLPSINPSTISFTSSKYQNSDKNLSRPAINQPNLDTSMSEVENTSISEPKYHSKNSITDSPTTCDTSKTSFRNNKL